MAKVKKGYSLDHAYQFFKKKHGINMDKKTYRELCYAFNKMLVDDILEGKMTKLPHRLGSLWIKKYQIDPNNPPIDLNETKRTGKIVYHLNFHSDGFSAKWAWKKRNNLVTNLIYYSFQTTRANSRALARVMKEEGGHKRYFS